MMMMPLLGADEAKNATNPSTQLTAHPSNPPYTTTAARHILGCGKHAGPVSLRLRRVLVPTNSPLLPPKVDLLPIPAYPRPQRRPDIVSSFEYKAHVLESSSATLP